MLKYRTSSPIDIFGSQFAVDRTKAKALIGQGWKVTYDTLFHDSRYSKSFSNSLAEHHIEAVEWHWNARIDILEKRKPDFYAYFPIWSRGHMKSSLAKRIAVIDAFLSFAYGVGGYCLYFSGTDDKTNKHAISINQLLQSKAMQYYAPELAKVKRSEEGSRSLGWKATFYYTEADYVFHFGSLQSGLAGGNVDDLRPTLLIPDDIDDRKDSIAVAETNVKAFTKEILPMGKTGTLTFYAQNLISRFSLMYRIHKNQLKILTNRKPTQPIPALIDADIKYRTIEGGIIQPYLTKGTPTWEQGMPFESCQEELERIGEESFRSECLHEVEQSKEGLVLYNYDDNVHAVSCSQFEAVFNDRHAWKKWYKVLFGDYAQTKSKYHANVAGYLAVASQNTPLAGHTFLVPMSFPAQTPPEDMAERFLNELSPFAYSQTTWKDLLNQAWKRLNPNHHFNTISERLEYLKSYYAELIPRYSQPLLDKCNLKASVFSHSEERLRITLNAGFGFAFAPANPAKNDGIAEINFALKVDYSLPHLFDESKKGYTRFHVLCPDDTTKQPSYLNGKAVYPPKPFPEDLEPDNLHDSDLFRYQIMNCRYREPKLTETGEVIDEPLKLNDDFKQGLQMVYFKQLLSNIALSAKEEFGVRFQQSTVFAQPSQANNISEEAQLNRAYQAGKIRKQMEKEGYDFFEDEDEDDRYFQIGNNSIDLTNGY